MDHGRVVEQQVPAVQPGEVRDARTEQHRHKADAHFVYLTEVERLLSVVGARDRHVLDGWGLPRRADSGLDPVDVGPALLVTQPSAVPGYARSTDRSGIRSRKGRRQSDTKGRPPERARCSDPRWVSHVHPVMSHS